MMSHWQVKSSQEIYKTKWIRVREDKILNHNNKPLTYSVVELRNPGVYVIPVRSDKRIYLQKQYQYTLDEWLWQLPTGGTDGEDLLNTAKRELLEETGLESNQFFMLGSLRSAIGIARVIEYVFLANNVTVSVRRPHDGLEEITELKAFSLDEIKTMIKKGEITESSTIAGLTMAFGLGPDLLATDKHKGG